jgi:hypothetical protein
MGWGKNTEERMEGDEGTKWKNVEKNEGEGATLAERGRNKEGHKNSGLKKQILVFKLLAKIYQQN